MTLPPSWERLAAIEAIGAYTWEIRFDRDRKRWTAHIFGPPRRADKAPRASRATTYQTPQLATGAGMNPTEAMLDATTRAGILP